MISSIHKAKISSSVEHIKIDTGLVFENISQNLLKFHHIQDIVNGFHPMVEPAGPEFADQDGPIRLVREEGVHVLLRFVFEVDRHQD